MLTGEPEVAWAVLASTEELRQEAKIKAKQKLLECADHYKHHEVKIADGPVGKIMDVVQFWEVGKERQRILEDTLEWVKELKAFISSEPALSSFWFVNELSTTLLAKACKKMKQQKKQPKV